jgi:phospholipid/cholesterol/gamma-HCH transport system permease protein
MAHEIIEIPESLTFNPAAELYENITHLFQIKTRPEVLTLDFKQVTTIDSAGVAVIEKIKGLASQNHCTLNLENISPEIRPTIDLFTLRIEKPDEEKKESGFFENIGDLSYQSATRINEIVIFLSNVFYWGFASFFKPKLRRKGEVLHQSLLMGVNALPIVGLIAFLIGFILALQAANQLQQFGANIFVVDLVAIAMISEMGPLITAIMVAGRSGSAVAAEIATMVVTEEIDALKVMGIDPNPYLITPKLFAIMITLPLLTIFANVIGILGGLLICVTYLDIGFINFYNEVISVLRYKELFISLFKSVVFAVIIVITGSYFGLNVKGGSEGVGRATTASVVVSIFSVIVADSIIGLIFYFN